MKGIMFYKNEIDLLFDQSNLQKIKKKGIDTVFLVIKDYNGYILLNKKVKMLYNKLKKFDLELGAWICLMIEGYEGKLTNPGINPYFEKYGWSVIDDKGNNTIEKPIICDLGKEQYACPNNENHNEFLIDTIKILENSGFFSAFVYDFIRFPLENNYCYCQYCKSFFSELTGKEIMESNLYERFIFKRYSTKKIANLISRKTTLWHTFLVWPEIFKNIQWSQGYTKWCCQRVSPMFYKTIDYNISRIEKKFRKTWGKEFIPLFLENNLMRFLETEEGKYTKNNYILTHYNTKQSSKVMNYKSILLQYLYRWKQQFLFYISKYMID